MQGQTHFDIIVIGAGSMGSAACYYLAKQGANVLALEQFIMPHGLGSHAGQSRIIRKAYAEHPDYVPLLQRAYENWKHLEEISGMQVYFKTGLLYSGKSESTWMQGVKSSAEKYQIEVNSVSVQEAQQRFSTCALPSSHEILFEPDAGFVTPEKAISLYIEKAKQLGAVIKTQTPVLFWEKTEDGYVVHTQKEKFFSKKLVITAGPWAGKLMPLLQPQLTVTRQVVAWVNMKNRDALALGKFPCWIIADENMPGIFYGFPVLPEEIFGEPIGFKLAHHYAAEKTDADSINRTTTAHDEKNILYALDQFFPGSYQSTHVVKTCLYTNTPDEHFIIDYLPGHHKDVAMAAGFSGHGFKFASAVGEILSDLVLKGKTDLPIGFLRAGRFV